MSIAKLLLCKFTINSNLFLRVYLFLRTSRNGHNAYKFWGIILRRECQKSSPFIPIICFHFYLSVLLFLLSYCKEVANLLPFPLYSIIMPSTVFLITNFCLTNVLTSLVFYCLQHCSSLMCSIQKFLIANFLCPPDVFMSTLRKLPTAWTKDA